MNPSSPTLPNSALDTVLGPISFELSSDEARSQLAPLRSYPSADQSYWSPTTPSSAYSQSSAPWSTPPASRPSSPASTIRDSNLWALVPADFTIPSAPCVLEMRLDAKGVLSLPEITPPSASASPQLIDRLLQFHVDPLRRCEPCALRGIPCEFVAYGLPCRDCSPNCRDTCDWLDGDVFLHSAGRFRNAELDAFRRELVRDDCELDELERFRAFASRTHELDDALLGAISRFKVNSTATASFFESMEAQVRSEGDIGRLGKFIELVHSSMSPRIVRAAAERVLEIMNARLRVSPIPSSST
ncbi:hypothetical protein MKEN_00403800 [Mycena kentingensis (nom. inval.)]|nr:hypothetical protein MKEN_00403800 [Mycena kentingensis (nom. inval.)]